MPQLNKFFRINGVFQKHIESVALAVQQMLLAEHGGSPGIRDNALLNSALTRPKQRFAYEPDSTLFELAPSYSYGIARNYPFIDGNKRVALAVGVVFLDTQRFYAGRPRTGSVHLNRRPYNTYSGCRLAVPANAFPPFP